MPHRTGTVVNYIVMMTKMTYIYKVTHTDSRTTLFVQQRELVPELAPGDSSCFHFCQIIIVIALDFGLRSTTWSDRSSIQFHFDVTEEMSRGNEKYDCLFKGESVKLCCKSTKFELMTPSQSCSLAIRE